MNSIANGPDFTLERGAFDQGLRPVAGVDEAGRGPWAGPVVAAAVILDPKAIPEGLDDSKKLTEAQREALFDEIHSSANCASAAASVVRVDRDNILAATLWAMAEAVAGLNAQPACVLIDGNKAPALDCTVQTVIKGDALSLSIAAASIIAKVTRDRLMLDLATGFPDYGWDRNKGYGTREHADALARLGPTPYHRRSFKPIRELLSKT